MKVNAAANSVRVRRGRHAKVTFSRPPEVWRRAREEGTPPHRISDRMAEERLVAARAARRAREKGA